MAKALRLGAVGSLLAVCLAVSLIVISIRTTLASSQDSLASHRVLERYDVGAGSRDVSVKTLFQDRDGQVWAGTNFGCAVQALSDRPAGFTRVEFERVRRGVRAVAQSDDGSLWFVSSDTLGFRGNSITRFHDGRWEGVEDSNNPLTGIALGDGQPMFQGAEGRVWFADYVAKPVDGLPPLREGEQRLLFPSEDELVCYQNGKWSPRIHLSNLPPSRRNVSAIAGLEDTEGLIWLAGSLGVAQVNRVTMQATVTEPLLGAVSPLSQRGPATRETHPNCIYEDRRGGIWIGASNGWVCRYDKAKGSWERRNLMEFAPEIVESEREFYRLLGGEDLDINAIYQGRDGRVMFGTNRGLFVVNDLSEKPTVYTEANSALPSRDVHCIMEDRDGKIWVGERYGIVVLEP
jgi:ligand-binding sensor domain-containing protein